MLLEAEMGPSAPADGGTERKPHACTPRSENVLAVAVSEGAPADNGTGDTNVPWLWSFLAVVAFRDDGR